MIFLLLAAAAASAASAAPPRTWLGDANPVAAAGATVLAGSHARFTVLAPAVIRMEYASDSKFDDRATVNILNRLTPVPAFTVARDGDGVTITTSALKLVYTGAEGVFSADNLSVELLVYPFSMWVPGTSAAGNLHGTIRTLDRVGEAVDLTCVVPRDAMTYYAHW